jgi:hypothetical protein
MKYLKELSFIVFAGHFMLANPGHCSHRDSLPSFQELEASITAEKLRSRFMQRPLAPKPLPIAQSPLPDFKPYAVVAANSLELMPQLSRHVSKATTHEATFVVEDAEAIAKGKSPKRKPGRKPNTEKEAPNMWAVLVPSKSTQAPIKVKRTRKEKSEIVDKPDRWQTYNPKRTPKAKTSTLVPRSIGDESTAEVS